MNEDRECAVSPEGHSFELRSVTCPICGPSDVEFVGYRGGRFHRYGRGLESSIVRCRGCSLMFPRPFPIPVNLTGVYADPDKYFESHDMALRVEAFRLVARQIRGKLGQGPLRLLDVGSGRGEMPMAAIREGFASVVGLEPSLAMVEFARATLNVELCPMGMDEFICTRPDAFDAITLNAVLEHVPDPDALIASCARLLRPGGVLYIDVPNEDNLLAYVAKVLARMRRSRAVIHLAPTFPPYHVWGFNRRSIGALLSKHSFAVEHLEVWAKLSIRSKGGIVDRVKALGATLLQPLANATGTAHNMFVWARREQAPG